MANYKITPEILEGAWRQILLKMPVSGGHSFLQKKLADGAIGLSAAVRVKDSMPGLILQIPDAGLAAKWTMRQLAGIRFEPAIKLDDGYGFPVMLADVKAREIFAVLASDILCSISGEGAAEAKLAALFTRLALWRRFLQKRMAPMSDEEVRGLIGELSVLEQVISAKGTDVSLEAWRGPKDELHDFHLPTFRVEVKTWSNNSLPRVFISDPSQVVVDEVFPVWLAAIQISSDDVSGRTLAEWVQSLRVGMDGAQLDLYDALLADCGFLPEHAEFYPQRFSVRDTAFYKITASFPKIDVSTLPPGVCCVRYAIELNAIASYAKPSPIIQASALK